MLDSRHQAARRRRQERVDSTIGLALLWVAPLIFFVMVLLRLP